jgi:hypothetical protein
MELLLNLAWILLALPGYWLWRQRTARASSRQCLLSLGCALVLLFPVISATDDLHAMRAEMEESSPGKRTVRLAPEKHSAWVNHLQSPGLVAGEFLLPVLEIGHLQVAVVCYAPRTLNLFGRAGRAPPSFLG